MTDTTLDGSSTPYIVATDTTDFANDGDALVLLGSIDNRGTLSLDGTGTPPTTSAPSTAEIASLIVASPTVVLTGGGTLELANREDSEIYGASATLVTLDNVNNTIEGEGELGFATAGAFSGGGTAYPVALINGAGGVIDGNGTIADQDGPPDGITIVAPATAPVVVNAGLIEATDIGGLAIIAATIDQSGGGTLFATGSNDVVFLSTNTASNGPDVIGGTIDATDGGGVYGIGTLDGSKTAVSLLGGGMFGAPSVLLGTIDNSDTLVFQTIFGGADLQIGGPTLTLAGNGALLLNDTNVFGAGGSLGVLVNVSNTIFGDGTIGNSAPVLLTNEAAGVIDASDTANALTIIGTSGTMLNAGLLEATGAGGLTLSSATLDNTGTLLASGAGVTLTLAGVSLITAGVTSTGGGVIEFAGGSNAIATPTGTLTITAGSTLDAASTLDVDAPTIDALGVFVVASSITLSAPTTLTGGGTLDLYDGSIGVAGSATLVNAGATIIGSGAIGGASLTLTNEATGVIDASALAIEFGHAARNAGLMEATAGGALSIGEEIATTIDNAGGTILANAASVTLDAADIVGGTLAATNGGEIYLGSVYYLDSDTLDGGSSGLTIAAATTLQDYYLAYDASFTLEIPVALTLLGTVVFSGTILGADGSYGSSALTNAGLLSGTGLIDGTVQNTGTLMAQGGRLRVTGDVDDAGSIAIAGGATFELGDGSASTVDFRHAGNATLLLDQPAAFTGTLANLTLGDRIDLGDNTAIKTATVVGGDTLAVALTNGSSLDYGIAGLAAHTSIDVRSATAAPSYTYDFTYSGTPGPGEPTESATGHGSFTVSDIGGTAALADVTAFSLLLEVSTTGGYEGAGTDAITFDPASLTSFAATFGSGGTLSSLSLAAGPGGDLAVPPGHVSAQGFTVFNLGGNGAQTEDASETSVSDTISTVGSIDVTPEGEVLSELYVACFAQGTRIRTARGDVAVEDLRLGDAVQTHAGGVAPIRWLGHRRVACGRHPRPRDVWPVRVRAHTFAQGQPARDLWLSPDHAVFCDGVLIPIRHLIDGDRIVQEARAAVSYWHVELDRHDVLLAEGLPAESFFDTGGKAAFAGTVTNLHAGFARHAWDGDACAPLAVGGRALDAVRARLAARHFAPDKKVAC